MIAKRLVPFYDNLQRANARGKYSDVNVRPKMCSNEFCMKTRVAFVVFCIDQSELMVAENLCFDE